MDITAFIHWDNDEDNILTKKNNKAKNHLGNLVTNNKFDTNDYSYMVQFIESHGTLKNLDLITKLLNDNSYIDKKLICDTLPTYFRLKTNKIKTNKNIWRNLSKLQSIKLTSEQLEGGKKFIKFIKNSRKVTFGLYGYAGTGKTTSTVEIIAYLIKNNFIKSVVFTAPTNKAVNVIKAKFRTLLKDIYEALYPLIKLKKDFDFENILDKLYIDKIKIDFITIHRLLEFKMDYNSDGGLIFMKNQCGKKKSSLLREYEIVVIDECSMIPMDLLDSIFQDIRNIGLSKSTLSNRMKIPKILFTGDPAQLPPVNETQSFIFLKNQDELTIDEYASKMHNSSIVSLTSDIDDIIQEKRKKLIDDILNIELFTLKKVVRSKIDNVTNFCYEIRKWVNGENDNPNFGDFHNKKGIKIYKYIQSTSKTDTKWFRKCLKYITKEKSSIILTWTNKQTDLYNEFIRRKIFGNEKLEKYVVGDILMLTEFYCLDSNTNNKSNDYDFCEKDDTNKFYTSDQIIVLKTKKKVQILKPFVFTSNKSIRKIKKYLLIENNCRQIINLINNLIAKKQYKYWKLTVNKIGEPVNTNHDIKVLLDSELEDYKKIKDEISGCILKFSTKVLEDFKDIAKQIETLVIKPLWKQWHEVFVMPFANVNYGYSITCHKGQGSNFYNVFVDIDDIGKNGNINEVKKCIYTAITRTINKLYILI